VVLSAQISAFARCASARIMQQGCSPYNRQVSTFQFSQVFCQAIDAQNMIKIMHRV
jgi:hypothetical protein